EQLAEHVKSYVSVTDKGVWKLEKNNQRTSGNSSSNTSDTPSATFSRSRFIIMLDMCRESDTVSAKAKKLAKQLAEELDK
ncbi:MAG: hypothetical protein KAS32_28955, partial [Candidatus Peribacteraceae bacterium]|nr:hypothetical protein [Candidatus Peribacteraceae bacterium]